MAEKRDIHGEKALSRKNEPNLSPSPDDELGAITIDTGPALGNVVRKHKETPWLKKNLNVVILAAAGVVLLVLLVVLASLMGWLGSGKKPKPSAMAGAQPTAKPQPGQPAPRPQVAPGQPAPPPQAPGQEPKNPGQEPKKEEPKKPPLPDDVGKWKKEDYFRARKENDPKLVKAVADLGRRCVGSEPAARGLTELLKPLPAEKPSAGPTPPPGPVPVPPPGPAPVPVPGPAQPHNPAEFTKLVEAIVEALGCNGSAPARDTLEQIIAGTFATDDDKAAVEAAVKTLAAHPCDENDALLFRVLTAADALRPADRAGPWTARDLQTKALELVKPAASSGLRTKLAAWLAGLAGGFDSKEPMHEFLMAADPRNCGAQLIFCKKADTPKDIKTTLEKQFLDYSSKAMARYLWIPEESLAASGGGGIGAGPPMGLSPPIVGGGGVPPGLGPLPGQPADQPAKAAEVNPSPHVAEQLWSDAFRALLEPRLSAKSTLEQQSQLLLLASTIPSESTRAVLYKVLNDKKRWYEGPKPLETAGLVDRLVTDPGLLVLIKMGGPRKDAPSAAAGTPRPGKVGRPYSPPTGGGKAAEVAKKQQTEQDWMAVSSKLVDSWRKRLYAAAQAKEKAEARRDGPADGAAASKLPEGLDFDPEATIKSVYHLSWPDDAPPEIAKLDLGLLEVYYVRAEESNRIKKLKTFYARQAKVQASEARMIDKSIWIDSLRTAVQKDRRRSLDVLITRTSGGASNATENNDEADFLIEALIVEIKDPTKD